MSDVQSRHCRPAAAEALEYRPRSAVSIPPLARQPARTPNRGGQVGSVRARFASVRRTADRHRSPRISRPRLLLERSGSDVEAGCLSGLLQRFSRAPLALRCHASATHRCKTPLLLLRLINTLGSSIAVGCFRHRSPPDCEFATHTIVPPPWQNLSATIPMTMPCPPRRSPPASATATVIKL